MIRRWLAELGREGALDRAFQQLEHGGLIEGCDDEGAFGHRDRAAARYRYPDRGVGGAASAGLPGPRTAGEPTRLRAFDVLSLAVSVSSMVAGWLALWIGP